MENPEQILIIVLAVTLSLFLIVAIVATVKIIQILNQLKAITEKAHKLADNAESIGEMFKNNAGPIALAKLVVNLSHAVFSRRKKSKGKV